MQRSGDVGISHDVELDDAAWLVSFLEDGGIRLRRALIARYGVELGAEANADAVAWSWEHVPDLRGMDNPVGYLYRVAQSSVGRQRRWRRTIPSLPQPDPVRDPDVEPSLVPALQALKPEQRTAVVLVHSYGYSYAEAADVLDLSVAAVTNHIHRGLAKLRSSMGVSE